MTTRGTVTDLQARLDVTFRLPGRSDFALECVVDTGFAGALTLSPAVITALRLAFFQEIDANLANDADVKTAVHIATIVWDGRELEVAVLAKLPCLQWDAVPFLERNCWKISGFAWASQEAAMLW